MSLDKPFPAPSSSESRGCSTVHSSVLYPSQPILIHQGHHIPLTAHTLLPKLRDIPPPRHARSEAQIGTHKAEHTKDRPTQRQSPRRCHHGNSHVYEAFGQIVGRNDPLESRMRRHGVLFQRRKISMAVMLDAGRDDEERETDERLDARRREVQAGYVEFEAGVV